MYWAGKSELLEDIDGWDGAKMNFKGRDSVVRAVRPHREGGVGGVACKKDVIVAWERIRCVEMLLARYEIARRQLSTLAHLLAFSAFLLLPQSFPSFPHVFGISS